jgi:16S rRNA (uracil1498-N3)-methyltransferase
MEIKATNFMVTPKSVDGNTLTLNETESHHLAKVMRAQIGDIFYAVDGQGLKHRVAITNLTLKKVTGEIINTTRLENEPLMKLTLAVGLCRPAKLDIIVEKGTELGVGRFVFFASERTLADDKMDRTENKRLSRWKKIAAAATKQSLRTVIPEIVPPVHFDDILGMPIDYHLALIADMTQKPENLETLLKDAARDILLLVGPEAGLSSREVKKAIERGYKPIKLGPRRLRSETAAILFTSLVMEKAGEI